MKDKLPAITETAFASQVESLFEIYHWHWCHFRPARVIKDGEESWRTAITGHRGFVDYIAVKGERCLFIEIKSGIGKLTESQEEWAKLLRACPGVSYHLWRPGDIEPNGGIIAGVLK